MLTVSTAEPSDASDIARVVNAAFQVERDYRRGDRTSAADVTRLMQGGIFLVARQNDGVAGAVYVRVTGQTGYFGMLAVEPSLQRSGVGRALREAAEEYCRARGCSLMTLSTGDFRQELLSYYARFGYQITGTEPAPENSPFTGPMKVVTMTKSLFAQPPSAEQHKATSS